MRRATTILLTAAALLAAGCGDDDGDDGEAARTERPATTADAAPQRAVTVNIASFKFVPPTITIAAGGSVTWVNQDKAPHTAENGGLKGPAEFDTDTLQLGDRKKVTFAKAGRYAYYCVFHRFMEADVIVK